AAIRPVVASVAVMARSLGRRVRRRRSRSLSQPWDSFSIGSTLDADGALPVLAQGVDAPVDDLPVDPAVHALEADLDVEVLAAGGRALAVERLIDEHCRGRAV